MIDSYLAVVIGGAILAGFVQGLSGFAFSLVALSIWAWMVDPHVAAPMAVFGSLVGQLTTLPLTWRGTDLRRLAPFVVGGLIGVPLGVFLLGVMDPAGFKLALGLFLLLYCPAMFFVPATLAVTWGGKLADAVSGWVGGIFGGIGGMAGAAPTLWITLRGWDKDTQRGVMQVFNIAMHVATLTAYIIAGHVISGEVLGLFAIIAPALIIPALLGAMLFRRMHQLAFRRLVLALLFVSGVVLTVSSLRG